MQTQKKSFSIGRVLVPATEYLQLVWETLNLITSGSTHSEVNVEFEDVRFLRATSMIPGQKIDLNIMVHYGSGQFEITENGVTVVSGIVRHVDESIEDDGSLPSIKGASGNNYAELDKKEFYKELRLRGYHYQQLFQSVENARCDGLGATIKWNDNWPSFMDCMLQLNILANDSRSLYLPTRIRKVRVNSMKHTQTLSAYGSESLPATYDPQLKLIKCGGIEIYDMVANSITRRKAPGLEVLDAYRFLPLVPSETLTLSDGVRVVTQLILENSVNLQSLKIVEIDHEQHNPIISVFEDAISETPLIKAEYAIVTDQDRTIDNVNVIRDKATATIRDYHLTITHNKRNAMSDIPENLAKLNEKAFLLLRQSAKTRFTDVPHDFTLVTAIPTENETLILLQKKPKSPTVRNPTVVEVLSNDYTYGWLEAVKANIKSGPILLYTQNDPSPGLLGLVNCLRREPGGENVRCVIVMDRLAPKFALDNSLYATQLDAGLAVNIYRNSVWGTYRFLKLKHHLQEINRMDHVFANVQRLGDLSSFDWFSGPLKGNTGRLVNVHYASINFRDVMLASGRLPIEVCRSSRTDDECVLGLEFSGITANGERVMGMIKYGAMASQIQPVEHLTWIIPKDFSLRDGATIPAVYITVYYAFFFYRSVLRGNSILIHAGSGGIGLAAIRIALAYGLDVFTTVSTEQKKKFILSLFPQLKGICWKIYSKGGKI